MELPSTEKGDPSFIETGFSGWKKATEMGKGFTKHEMSVYHKSSTSMVTRAQATKDISGQLSSQYEGEKMVRRGNLLKILSSVRFLARQGLPLRGQGDGSNSNLNQLLALRGQDDPVFRQWTERKSERKYTSNEIQQEMLKLMALHILRNVAANIRSATYFTIMADETTDISNREQVVICLRWVDDDLVPHEDFIGLHKVDTIDAVTIKNVILDVLLRLNLSMQKCRGQCYDGCSTMAGNKGGVATMIKKIEPRALYTHCYGHALNLACADTIKQCKLMKDALETAHEITKLVKLSPKRDANFQTIRESAADDGTSKNVRLLCRTRWTVRADAMQSVIDNYKELLELWDWSLDVYKDTETKARVQGVASQIERFDFFFGLALGARILKHADSLSTTLQRKDLSSCEGQEIAFMTVKTLEGIRNDDSFNLFWQRVTAESKLKEVNDPQLPRKRRAPIRVEECFSGSAKAEFPAAAASAYFRHAHYETLYLVISCIKSRFDQTDYKIHSSCERVLLKSVSGGDFTEELKTVTQFYGSDFSAENLRSHLEILGSNYSGQGQPNIHDIFEYLRHLTPAKRALMGDAVKLAKLIMSIPATNASSERAFSTLRYVKNHLRNTMLQERLNSLMVTYVHRDELDHLNMNAIADDFVNGRENRMGFFGSFDS